MNDVFSTLRQRFPASDQRVSDLAGVFNTVNSFVPVISKWKQEVAGNKHLSQAGVSSAYRKKISENVMREVRKMKEVIEDSKAKLAASKINVMKPKYDPTDMLAAAYRREIREFLRQADPSQRIALVMSDTADPIFTAAALELPTVISGLTEQHAEVVRKVYAERHHPDVLEHIQVREDALEVMTAFASAFKNEVKKEAGISRPDLFEAWYETGTEPEVA